MEVGRAAREPGEVSGGKWWCQGIVVQTGKADTFAISAEPLSLLR